MKIIRLLILFSFLVLSPPIYAQLSLGANPQPAAPQTAEMTRYGNHNVNLYTGRVSVSIPIGEYRDKDFSIPVSLEYNYNGMRPNEQAAEPGLGWFLSCGGVITREVIGLPDEGESGGEHPSFRLFLVEGSSTDLEADILPFDKIPFASLGSSTEIWGQALSNYDKPETAVTVAYNISGHFYDASSDIYHFRMPGHNGSFYRNDDGTFTVFDTGSAGGTYQIEKTNVARSGEGCRSQIIITTGDGYKYIFGSLEDDDNYVDRLSFTKEPTIDRGTIVAWRLREIVSRGGRSLHFSYFNSGNGLRTVKSFNDERWVFSSSGFADRDLFASSFSTTYAPLVEVKLEDQPVINFVYSQKDAQQSGCFINRNGTQRINPDLATMTLDTVVINEVKTQLSYCYNAYGNPYPFLIEVHTDGVGSWRLTYEGLTEGYFPPFWTAATDHWGYLNQTESSQCNRYSIDWSTISALGADYSETEAQNSSKKPDTTAVRLGILTDIIYPTGGRTSFYYSANRYDLIVDKRLSNGFLIQDTMEAGIGPGVRVFRIENRDVNGLVTESQVFSYQTGRLLSPFRHRISYHGYLAGYSPQYEMTVNYMTTGGLFRPGSVIIEYPSVIEKRLDGSETKHSFTDWSVRPDILTDDYVPLLRIEPNYNTMYGFLTFNNASYVHRILEPLSSLQHYRGKPHSLTEYADGMLKPIQSVRANYDFSEPTYRYEYINVGDACARVRHYAGEPRLMSKTTVSHYNQDSVLAVTHYAYNALGQVISERTMSSDGDSLIVLRTYPQDYPQDALLAEMAAANFVDYPVTEVHLRRRGASTFDTTAAVRYEYTRYITAAGDSSYAASAVHRRRSNGDWVTEGSFVYDNAGNVIQRTDADGIVTSYVWNSVYGVSIVVENASRSQVTACLAQSPAVDITNTAAAASRLRSGLPQARVSDFEYRRAGLPTRMTDPSGHTLRYYYDENDRLVTVREDDAGILQQYQYNTVTR